MHPKQQIAAHAGSWSARQSRKAVVGCLLAIVLAGGAGAGIAGTDDGHSAGVNFTMLGKPGDDARPA